MNDQEKNDQEKEDRELIERISRAPARYSFYVDVGKVSPEDAEAYLKKIKKRLKNNPPSNPMDSIN